MAELSWLRPFNVTIATAVRDADGLRTRARADGYLLIRGLIPAADLLAVRQAILGVLSQAGWCDREGRVPPDIPRHTEGEAAFMSVYDAVQRLEGFHRLALHPALLDLYRALFGERPLAHPRNIARVMFPANSAQTTPPHQDHMHIGGTPETWTAWIPLGPCPLALGGLALMAGSQAEPLLPVHAAPGAGGAAVDTAALDYPWAGGDMAPGDILTFHSHLVHAGLPNLTVDRMRLSVDFRYQPLSHPVRVDSLDPHHRRLSWEEIYAGWDSAADRYYWHRLGPHVVS